MFYNTWAGIIDAWFNHRIFIITYSSKLFVDNFMPDIGALSFTTSLRTRTKFPFTPLTVNCNTKRFVSHRWNVSVKTGKCHCIRRVIIPGQVLSFSSHGSSTDGLPPHVPPSLSSIFLLRCLVRSPLQQILHASQSPHSQFTVIQNYKQTSIYA